MYSAEEIQEFASKMLGYKLITKQTGSRGRRCDKVGYGKQIREEIYAFFFQVLVVEKMKLLSEYYFAIVMDRAFKVLYHVE